ncbi:MAG: RNA polymerase sigma factor [Eubacterium sp.]|nr:RNA polymerase sigma factor [Eubacterium sp.]
MNSLIKKAKAHDAECFVELMQQQLQSMYKIAKAMLSSEEDIADAFQETILTCWEKIHQLEEERFFRTWLIRILINKCNDILRQKQKFVLVEELPEVPKTDLGFANLEWEEVLNSLDEKYRIVVILYYVEGFKTSEIAEMLGIQESSVRTRLSRSKEKLARDYYPDLKRRNSV